MFEQKTTASENSTAVDLGRPQMGQPFYLSISKTDHLHLTQEVPLNLNAAAEDGKISTSNGTEAFTLAWCTSLHVPYVIFRSSGFIYLFIYFAVSSGKQLPSFWSTWMSPFSESSSPIRTWWWRRNLLSKLRYLSARRQRVTAHKNRIFSNIAVTASNPTSPSPCSFHY